MPLSLALYTQRVKLTKFEKGSLLARDLDKYAAQYKREVGHLGRASMLIALKFK